MSTRLWHPFADMAAVKEEEVVIVRGRGARVWDAGGKEYVDARAGLWYAAVGHGRAEIADAVAAQMRELAAFDTFERLANRPALELAERVSSLAPFPDAAVFFGSGGSDAVDTAAKLARRYWSAVGRPEKQVIVSREHGYHGVNGFGTSLQGIPGNRAGYGDLIPHVENIPWGDAAALEALFADHADKIAAVIGEPVIGAGGVIPPPEGFWPRVQELCREHDVLLISDEVICGFGRLGAAFGCQRFGVTPDLMTCAKGLTSGYMPMGAVVVSERVKEPFFREGFGTLIADVASVPHDDPAALEALFEERAGEIAAFIGEPVIGAGGILHPAEGYWAAVQELCRKHNVLLIADEVVTGFGRLGRWFGCQRLGIEPDMITCAKAITSGYLPLGAVVISARVQEPFWTEPGRAIFRHGFTYSGHPAACAAGLANLDLMEREELVDRVAEMEPVLAQAVAPLTGLTLVSEVRAGLGLLAAVEIDPEARAADPGLVERIVAGCRRNGVLTRGLAGRALQLSPPYVISEEEIATVAETIATAVTQATPAHA